MGRRTTAIDHLYRTLAHLLRRRSELGGELHPELSLVGYTFLGEIEAAPGSRAADLAALFGLDKSTVSRQLDQLESAGYLERQQQQGRRGSSLSVTTRGRTVLERDDERVRERLGEALSRWKVLEIAALAEMLDRLVDDVR